MPTVINNPPPTQAAESDSGVGAGLIIGVIIALLLVGIFLVYAWPYFSQISSQQQPINNINIENPPPPPPATENPPPPTQNPPPPPPATTPPPNYIQ